VAGLVGLLLLSDLPEIVRRKALLRPDGERWLRELPGHVAELAAEWGFAPGEPLPGSSESLVLTAGPDAVLKVGLPNDPASALRARLLERAGGRGYVRVLAYDAERNALLLERLGPSLRSRGLPVTDELAVLASTLAAAWQLEPERGLPTAVEKAASLCAFISELFDELGAPCSPAAVETALAYLDSRAAAFDPAAAVVLHGDAHAANALAGREGGYRFVDPEFFVGEPAYDLGISIREWGDDRDVVQERCELLAELAGSDAQAIWEWGYAELVSTGLFIGQVGSPAAAAHMYAVAERWLP